MRLGCTQLRLPSAKPVNQDGVRASPGSGLASSWARIDPSQHGFQAVAAPGTDGCALSATACLLQLSIDSSPHDVVLCCAVFAALRACGQVLASLWAGACLHPRVMDTVYSGVMAAPVFTSLECLGRWLGLIGQAHACCETLSAVTLLPCEVVDPLLRTAAVEHDLAVAGGCTVSDGRLFLKAFGMIVEVMAQSMKPLHTFRWLHIAALTASQ